MGFSKVTRDFTARRAVEAILTDRAAAAESNRVAEECARLQRLVASVSHEIPHAAECAPRMDRHA